MKELSSCIVGVDGLIESELDRHAVMVCPGISTEFLDAQRFDNSVVITVNSMLTKMHSDYSILMDPYKLDDLFLWFEHRPKTTMVISEEVLHRLDDNPPIDYRSGRSGRSEISKTKGIVVHDHIEPFGSSSNSVIVAFEMAHLLGISSMDIYGLDLCSPSHKTHAYNMGKVENKSGTMLPNGLYSYVEWNSLKKLIEKECYRWRRMKIVNRSERSTLECFPKERRYDGDI